MEDQGSTLNWPTGFECRSLHQPAFGAILWSQWSLHAATFPTVEGLLLVEDQGPGLVEPNYFYSGSFLN